MIFESSLSNRATNQNLELHSVLLNICSALSLHYYCTTYHAINCVCTSFADQKGLSGLSYAIKHEQDDIIGRLLEEKKIVLTDSLHCAVDAENYSAVLSLLKRGADPNQVKYQAAKNYNVFQNFCGY